MKFFLQILLVIGVIIMLFLLLGYLVTEQSTVSEVEVNAPIDFCWEMYHDESKATQWMEGVERIEYISGSKNKIGAKKKITLSSSAQTNQLSGFSEIIQTIKQFDRPTYYSYDYSNDLLTGSTELKFTMNGDSATTIINVDKFRANKLWMRSILFLIKGSINENSQSKFDQMKMLIENEYEYSLPKDSLAVPTMITEPDTVN